MYNVCVGPIRFSEPELLKTGCGAIETETVDTRLTQKSVGSSYGSLAQRIRAWSFYLQGCEFDSRMTLKNTVLETQKKYLDFSEILRNLGENIEK